VTEHKPTPAARRAILQAGLAVAAGGAVTQAQAQQKLAQNLIMYQDTPKDGQRCDACVHWQPPNACAIVEGPIAAAGWCGAFAPKT
jgi:FPC/CPF motif-containing protein YcgG